MRWRHAPEARRVLGIWSKLVELRLDTGREGLTFACLRRPWAGVARDGGGGGRWKSQNRKIVPLSLYVEKPLNAKAIKSFVPELRSRKCFSCFEIPMFNVYIYEHPMYISHIHVYGYGTVRHDSTRIDGIRVSCCVSDHRKCEGQRIRLLKSLIEKRLNVATTIIHQQYEVYSWYKWIKFVYFLYRLSYTLVLHFPVLVLVTQHWGIQKMGQGRDFGGLFKWRGFQQTLE